MKIVVSQQEFLKNYKTYKDIDGVVDAITYAQQLGRLDVISLILSMFGILIGIFAIGWFGFIRNEAKDIARNEVNSIMTSQEIQNIILNTVKQKAEEMLNTNEMRQDLSNRVFGMTDMTDINANSISENTVGTGNYGDENE